jgi:hypothetical protein
METARPSGVFSSMTAGCGIGLGGKAASARPATASPAAATQPASSDLRDIARPVPTIRVTIRAPAF